jgi:hypothetical protein
MNIKLFHKLFKNAFPNANTAVFCHPIIHNAMGIQFINEEGEMIPPFIKEPIDFLFAEPLNGLYYNLNVLGIVLKKEKDQFGMSVIVEPEDGKFETPAFIHFNASIEDIQNFVDKINIQLGNILENKVIYYETFKKALEAETNNI